MKLRPSPRMKELGISKSTLQVPSACQCATSTLLSSLRDVSGPVVWIGPPLNVKKAPQGKVQPLPLYCNAQIRTKVAKKPNGLQTQRTISSGKYHIKPMKPHVQITCFFTLTWRGGCVDRKCIAPIVADAGVAHGAHGFLQVVPLL